MTTDVPLRRDLPWHKKSAIYLITNEVNGKMYVGSTVRNLYHRLSCHRNELRRGVHGNPHLQAAWKKYGEAAFKFEMLESCEPENCLDSEQWWIDQLDTYKTGYNRCPTAGNRAGTKHSEETRKLLSERQRGRKASEETRAKMSETRKGKKPTKEACENLKASHWKHGPRAVEIAARIAKANTGLVHSAERRKANSEGRLRQLAEKRTALAALLADMEEPTPPKTGGARLPDRFVTK